MDNAATTPVVPAALEAMLPYFCEEYGNASSIFYSMGSKARATLDAARKSIAEDLHCTSGEVFFTSCGTEADNWAIKGTAQKMAVLGKKHLVTSNVEHHAVLHSMKALEKQGFTVTYVPVDNEGFVNPQDVAAAIRHDTALVSVMYANNEIGTIQPIAEIAAICRQKNVRFHTDAVQAVGAIDVNFSKLGADMLSLSAHKFGGPKGVGALLIRKGAMPAIFMDGGAQERAQRAGTENIAGIVGLSTALHLATSTLPQKTAQLTQMRDFIIAHIQGMPQTVINGTLQKGKRLPGNINASFTAAEGESMLLLLDQKGICASSGSACASGDLDPSHVLLAIGLKHEIAHCSIRLSLGAQNTMQQAQTVCNALDDIVPQVRQRSPLWKP